MLLSFFFFIGTLVDLIGHNGVSDMLIYLAYKMNCFQFSKKYIDGTRERNDSEWAVAQLWYFVVFVMLINPDELPL